LRRRLRAAGLRWLRAYGLRRRLRRCPRPDLRRKAGRRWLLFLLLLLRWRLWLARFGDGVIILRYDDRTIGTRRHDRMSDGGEQQNQANEAENTESYHFSYSFSQSGYERQVGSPEFMPIACRHAVLDVRIASTWSFNLLPRVERRDNFSSVMLLSSPTLPLR